LALSEVLGPAAPYPGHPEPARRRPPWSSRKSITQITSGHALTHPFAVFGYHVTGSTGTLFLYGIVAGALALFGLSLLPVGARRTSRRGARAAADSRNPAARPPPPARTATTCSTSARTTKGTPARTPDSIMDSDSHSE
jgi:hypothetical protein